MTNAPLLEGIHHVKLPVSDLEKSLAWYSGHLGYVPVMHFVAASDPDDDFLKVV
jgi:catechol 2,3-dioxygenase-like lactoylglutathione lyase family enzyme